MNILLWEATVSFGHSIRCCSLTTTRLVCWLIGCFTSQQHASVSQARICSDKCMCCHTEMEEADQTFHLTQSQCTFTWPTSPSADPIAPSAWQVATGVPMFNSLHTKLFPVFTGDEAIPLKQNNETKRRTVEIWFAHTEIVN